LSGNLDRIQIVKGWLDANGKTHEKIYDVVWSDSDTRKRGANGKLPNVGNTVDVAKATWRNTIGDPELIAVWTDPDFDPKQRAVYYARVIEIPTPRWTAYDAKRFGIKMPKEVEMITQERAYTSPIWYTPCLGFRLEKMNFERRTLNVKRRMAGLLTDGLGSIGSSKLEVERWTLEKISEERFGIQVTKCLGQTEPYILNPEP